MRSLGMADQHLISLQPGTVIGNRYEVVKCLGAGSMGLVYACRHRELAGHLVAIKVLFPEVAQDNVAAARFRNEIVASYGVSHPNVVRAYEYFRDGDLVAYTMEFVGGGDLADRLGLGEPIAIADVIRYLAQIAAGVQAVHDAGIVHRDLKPENILLTPEGDVKITDFGIARAANGPKLTEHGGVVGTIDYVSPEYLERGQVDARSDIYALGVLGYEMITGESPFRGDSVIATMTMRLRSDPKLPSELRPECPPELDRVIQKALARVPEERYQRAVEIVVDLKPLLPEDLANSGTLLVGSRSAQVEMPPQTTPSNEQPKKLPRAPSIIQPPGSSVLDNGARRSDTGPGAGFTSVPRSPGMFERLQGIPPGGQSGVAAGSRGIAHIAQEFTEDTIQEPLRMESVLSGAHAAPPQQPLERSFSNRLDVSVDQGGLDRQRIRTLSRSVGEFHRSTWLEDAVLLVIAVVIGVGVGLAILSYFWPDFFKEKRPTFDRGDDISIFDNAYYP